LATSIIFPAFVSEYTGSEEKAIAAFENNFSGRIEKSSDITGSDLTGFDFGKNNFLQDELKSQYISYIFSCSVADILKNEKIKPSFVSGYSMGLYAALYYCGSVSFNEGLMLVKRAWTVIDGLTGNGSYSMGMIIGLEENDLRKLLKTSGEVEICNQNNKLTFIISGLSDAVESVLLSAKEEGAMRANSIPVTKPYHSHFLQGTGPEFTRLIKNISFSSPVYKYISAIDQQSIITPGDLRNEVIRNLCSRMKWLETMNLLITRGTDIFFECGAGDGLSRNTRFIEGNFKSFSVAKLDKFLETAKE
jgi:[acyl-carrier-protein] S-malonyltransferase